MAEHIQCSLVDKFSKEKKKKKKKMINITKTRPCNIQRHYSTKKKFNRKLFDIFDIFAQNIDRG